MPTKPAPFNVLLSALEKDMLSTIANHAQASRGQVIRQSIRWRFEMQIKATPICASGHRCLAPHFHQATAPPTNSPTP